MFDQVAKFLEIWMAHDEKHFIEAFLVVFHHFRCLEALVRLVEIDHVFMFKSL
jgi:hypothetical protein